MRDMALSSRPIPWENCWLLFFFFDILSLCSVQNYETRPTNFARNHEKTRSLSLLVTQCMERYKMKTTCQPTKDLPEAFDFSWDHFGSARLDTFNQTVHMSSLVGNSNQ
ncbi:hypothetical protein WN943_000641 [Citrus x changshan-huyou]